MRTIMAAKTPHDSSFSFSRRYFWKKKVDDDEDDDHEVLNFSSYSHFSEEEKEAELIIQKIHLPTTTDQVAVVPRKKHSLVSVSKLRSALNTFRQEPFPALAPSWQCQRVFWFEKWLRGLVRIALECEKKTDQKKKKGLKLLEEPQWRTYCNGKKCGFAMRRDCGPEEWKVLKALEPISMGAGVLPGNEDGAGSEGELMYMRAKFERVVGSKDSEAFYMMNPDGSGGPELSVYLLRV
ncbi:hypothetical protein M0R45_021967 [Rubus argutus]|uniref:Protein MIZU-KUSSEI 1-like n=1 Tax=Rubus argutus TaxID=59490 RepID=A0AAW1XD21_RUBAR